MGPFQTIGAFFKAIVVLFNATEKLAKAVDNVAEYCEETTDHWCAKQRLERIAEIRDVRAQLKLVESEAA